jgi:DNA repair photolyase
MISLNDPSVRLVECSSALSESGLYDIDYALNPYRGCAHGCLYCYAPDVIRTERGDSWGSWVEARTNISRVLRKELPGIGESKIGLATVTDPYQPAEESLGITRACLEAISQSDASLMLMTKSPLARRDFDVLGKIDKVEFCVTVTTLDEDLAKMLEPGAPAPAARLQLLRDAKQSGLRTSAMLSPWLVSSDDPEKELSTTIEALAKAGCSNITVDRLRLRPTAVKRIGVSISAGGRFSAQIASAVKKSSGISIEKMLASISARKRFPGIAFEIPPID